MADLAFGGNHPAINVVLHVGTVSHSPLCASFGVA